MFRTQILVDNVANAGQGEWGFSAVIEADNKRILFDVGASALFRKNADILGQDLLKLDYVVLSHGHWDHTWGLNELVRLYLKNSTAARPTLVAHPRAFERTLNPKGAENGPLLTLSTIEDRFPVKLSAEPLWLTENLLWLGEIKRHFAFEYVEPKGRRITAAGIEPDLSPDDTALAYKSDEGLIIITGCSHSGICNIIEQAMRLTEESRVLDIIGGTHLLQIGEARMAATLDYFARVKPKALHIGHCTGLDAKIALAGVADVKELFVGLEVKFGD